MWEIYKGQQGVVHNYLVIIMQFYFNYVSMLQKHTMTFDQCSNPLGCEYGTHANWYKEGRVVELYTSMSILGQQCYYDLCKHFVYSLPIRHLISKGVLRQAHKQKTTYLKICLTKHTT